MNPFEVLGQFCSTDETRYALRRPYFDGERLVATDGHRLFATRDLQGNKPPPIGYVSLLEAWQGKRLIADHGDGNKFPEWKNVLPTDAVSMRGTLRIPAFLEDLEPHDTCVLCLSRDGIRFGEFGDSTTVAVNAALLAPLAGEDVRVHLRFGVPLPGPIVITPHHSDDPLANEWFAIVMPMRPDAPAAFPSPRIWKPDA